MYVYNIYIQGIASVNPQRIYYNLQAFVATEPGAITTCIHNIYTQYAYIYIYIYTWRVVNQLSRN